jgi:hypothetical protein
MLLLAASVLLPIVGAAATTGELYQTTECSPERDLTVSVHTASSIASLKVNEIAGNIPDFADWRNGNVEFSTTYYNLEGVPTAYSFDVVVNGDTVDTFSFQQPGIIIPSLSSLKGSLPTNVPNS